MSHDCCLRGGADFKTLLEKGSGMDQKFATENAKLSSEAEFQDEENGASYSADETDSVTTANGSAAKRRKLVNSPKRNSHIAGRYDTGAATVLELLTRRGPWDFAVLNDYTQAPAREESMIQSIKILCTSYAPLLVAATVTPVLMESHAYRENAKGSEDLGNHEQFTRKIQQGYESYASALSACLPPDLKPRLAPIGTAFLVVRTEREQLWRDLFHTDNVHPSPLGTYLQACVLHCTIFGRPPPINSMHESNSATLWAHARLMQPPCDPPLRLPTAEEMRYVRDIAVRVCGLSPVVITSVCK